MRTATQVTDQGYVILLDGKPRPAQLEERFPEPRWGADGHVLSKREKITADVADSARFMVLCAP